MSVVANVAINVDSRDASAKLRQFQQQSLTAAKAAQDLQKTTDATGAAATKAGRQYQTAANGMRYFIDATGRARKENGQFVTTAEAAAAGLEKQSKAAGKAAGALRGLGGIIASISAGALVANMVRGAAAAEQLQLRLKLLSGEYGETARIQQFVAQSAETFGQSQIEAASGVADVYARLRPLGVSLDQIETIYKGFNATALASGTSAEAASSAFLQLSQALGSGTLQGDEFRSVAEQVPGILRLVAGELGVTVGELKKLGSEGKITSDVLINALAKGFDENSSKIKTLLDQSPAQRFKEFKDSTQALSNAIGSELLPAIVPMVKLATELLQLFGQLPGPVKTLIAAVVGLTAAFVALAPAISAATSLLGGLSLATLAAAGPWIALAAGITAAAVALASYQSEAQKVAGAAKAGTAADVVKARNLSVQTGQEISLLEQQRKTASGRERASIDRRLRRLRADQAELQSAITASTADRPTAAALPPGVTGSGGGTTAKGGGASKTSDEAEKLAKELERSLEAGRQLATQFNRQVLLLKASDEIEKQRLQIQFDYEDRAKQIAELKNTEQQAALTLENTEIRRLQLIDLQTEALKKQAEEAQKLFEEALGQTEFGVAGEGTVASGLTDAISKLKEELDPVKLQIDTIVNGATAIGDAFSTAFGEVITGAKSTQEALADAFQSIGKAFINMALEIIAKQMTLIILQTILNALSGGGTFGTANKNLSGTGALKSPSAVPSLKVGGYAEGGFVTGPTNALIGEGGEPEYVIPASKMAGAMARYASGLRGSGVVDGAVSDNRNFLDSLTTGFNSLTADATEEDAATAGAAATRASLRETERFRENQMQIMNQQTERERRYERERIEQMASTPGNLNIKYESQVINNVEYVTRDQAERLASQSALRGRELAINALQTSVKTRKRVGMA